MNLLFNIIWVILGGFASAIVLFLAGVVLCITVVGIPFGKQCFKLAKLSFAPFGKKVTLNVHRHPVANAAWVILFGWELFLSYAIVGVVLCITVIGIPFGKQLFKFAKLMLVPFGAEVF